MMKKEEAKSILDNELDRFLLKMFVRYMQVPSVRTRKIHIWCDFYIIV